MRSHDGLPAPRDLRVRTTGFPGQAHCRVRPLPRARCFEGQCALASSPGTWMNKVVTTNAQKILYTGLERGQDYLFRVRAIGVNGHSPWSAHATMMVV